MTRAAAQADDSGQLVTTIETTTTNYTNTTEESGGGIYPKDLFDLEQRKQGAVVLHVIGMLYMFVALAVVCDEFFVPSLEVIINRLQISDDVAGATFMAAGGSAPELFTSIIGVFLAKSNVGIGTIVGSAVFNILFVIGCCGLLSLTVLELTWWPLFRDCTFYIISLTALIIAFLDEEIKYYESIILLVIYLCYVIFMKNNQHVEAFFSSKLKLGSSKPAASHPQPNGSRISPTDDMNPKSKIPPSETGDHLSNSNFSMGVIHRMLTNEHSHPMHTGHGGSFAKSPSGQDMYQGKRIRLTSPTSTTKLSDIERVVVSEDKDPKTTTVIYKDEGINHRYQQQHFESCLQFENCLCHQYGNGAKVIPNVFSGDDMATQAANVTANNRQMYDDHPDPHTNHTVPPAISENQSIQRSLNKNLHRRASTISHAIQVSRSFSKKTNGNASQPSPDEEDEDEGFTWAWPDTFQKQIVFLIVAPIFFVLWITLPDVRKPGKEKYFFVSFFVSITWIAVFSYLMVWWAHQIGETIGIDETIMGLTFLAAGTSVPDLITSVIVARKGLGDMAVSSSVGSNIFDVTVGLPFPWLLSSIIRGGAAVEVKSKGLFCSILLLAMMLLFVISSIAACKWKMNKQLGCTMLVLYCVFVVLTLLLEFGAINCPVST